MSKFTIKKGNQAEVLICDNDYENDDFEAKVQLYLERLTTTQDDVAELMWHFYNTFWPDFYENKQSIVQNILET